jgi:hypothetical protein
MLSGLFNGHRRELLIGGGLVGCPLCKGHDVDVEQCYACPHLIDAKGHADGSMITCSFWPPAGLLASRAVAFDRRTLSAAKTGLPQREIPHSFVFRDLAWLGARRSPHRLLASHSLSPDHLMATSESARVRLTCRRVAVRRTPGGARRGTARGLRVAGYNREELVAGSECPTYQISRALLADVSPCTAPGIGNGHTNRLI